jgi:ArsR family transcriptional regulator, arsenate/arsenite/antimonite-responsive transcriptional repressor
LWPGAGGSSLYRQLSKQVGLRMTLTLTRRTSRHRPVADVERVSARLKALADPTRLRILSQLLQAGEAVCACEIAGCFEQGQPTISHHLRTLREAGLVQATRKGTWVYYEPERQALDEVRAALGALPECCR